jgi:hypothetical protein
MVEALEIDRAVVAELLRKAIEGRRFELIREMPFKGIL